MNKSQTLSDHIQVWNFENDLCIYTDGSLGFGIELQSLDTSCFSNEKINGLKEKVANFLNSLPPDIYLQFVVDDLGDSLELINTYAIQNENTKNKAVKEITGGRISKLRADNEDKNLPKKRTLLLVRTTGQKKNSFNIFSTMKKINNNVEENFRLKISETGKIKNEILSGLEQLDLKPKILPSKQLSALIFEEWNPLRTDGVGELNPIDIREQLVLSDVGIYEKGFQIAGKHHRVISIKNLPEQTYSLMAEKLKDLPFGSRTYLSIYVPNQAKELESLQTQRRIAFSMVQGSKGVDDLESQAKLQDIEELLEEMVASNEKVFNMALNIVLKADSEEELESQISDILIKLRELSGTEGVVESLASFKIFSELALPHAKCKERQKKVKTSTLSDLLPIFGYWRGHKNPSIFLKNDGGEIFNFNPFDETLSNANQLICGASGSGKSFLCNNIVLQKLKENPKVFFIDIGGSYQKLCENLGGQYIELDLKSQMTINPFDLMPGEKAPTSSKVKFLVGLIELMVKDDDRSLSKLIRSEIENAIFKVYDNHEKPRLSDLKDIFLENSDVEVQNIGKTLRLWCTGSPYGEFLDNQTTIDIKSDLISFDLKGLENHPDLQTVCLYIITDMVWREVQDARGREKFLIFDECWKLLKSESGLNFIEEVVRTFRKYNASAIAISQDLFDFSSSKIASAILPNCSIKWLLMQGNLNRDRLRTVLGVNDNELELIGSLSQSRGNYSEAFLISGSRRALLSVEPTPIETWISTTSPKDLSKIEEEKKKAPEKPIINILKDLAERFPQGVS